MRNDLFTEADPGGGVTTRAAGVLVIDDDDAVRALLELFLRREGYAVQSASDGAAGLDVYRRLSQDIHLVLLDVRMPGLDGPATLTALRQVNPSVLCCFISGEMAPYSRDDLEQLGAVEVFAKPFVLADLAGRLRELLG